MAVEQPFRERELVSVCLSRKRHWDAMKRFGFAPRDRMWPREVGEHQAERGRCLVAGSSPPLGSSPPGSLGWPRVNEANVNLSGTAAQEIAATSSVDDRLKWITIAIIMTTITKTLVELGPGVKLHS